VALIENSAFPGRISPRYDIFGALGGGAIYPVEVRHWEEVLHDHWEPGSTKNNGYHGLQERFEKIKSGRLRDLQEGRDNRDEGWSYGI
jgi:hypothetical protein